MNHCRISDYTIVCKGLCIVIAFLFPATAREQSDSSLQSEVLNLLHFKNYSLTAIEIAVRDVEHDSVLIDINADSMTNPASVSKLITAAAAFEQLGLGYTFSTRIFGDSFERHGNTVTVKNLYIQGGADPGFTAERLWLFVEHLYHSGLRKISGDLVMDDYFLDSIGIGPGFDEESSGESYLPFINALSVNFNTIGIHRRPGSGIKDPVAIDLFPEISGVKVRKFGSDRSIGDRGVFENYDDTRLRRHACTGTGRNRLERFWQLLLP